MSKNNGGKFVLGAIVGAVAGAVTGLLFAPKSGKELRSDIGDKAKDITEKGKEFAVKEATEVKKMTEEVVEKIKN